MSSYEYNRKHKAYVKACPSCKETFVGLDDEKESIKVFAKYFGYREDESDGFQHNCKRCNISASRKSRGAFISHEQMEALTLQQNNKCAICSEELDRSSDMTKACVDHDHETGAIRGILCNGCNRGLGQFKDSIRLLNRATEYLISHSLVVSIKRRV